MCGLECGSYKALSLPTSWKQSEVNVLHVPDNSNTHHQSVLTMVTLPGHNLHVADAVWNVAATPGFFH